jgi:hypothetical protein
LAVALESKAMPAEDYDALHQHYLTGWHELVRATAVVEIAGPSPVASAATEMLSVIGDVADVCDNWHRARRSRGPGHDAWKGYSAASDAAREAHATFVGRAQESLRNNSARQSTAEEAVVKPTEQR